MSVFPDSSVESVVAAIGTIGRSFIRLAKQEPAVPPVKFRQDQQPIKVMYTNHRGETGVRTITPLICRFDAGEYHPTPRWLLECYDHDKQAYRTYDLAWCDFILPTSRETT